MKIHPIFVIENYRNEIYYCILVTIYKNFLSYRYLENMEGSTNPGYVSEQRKRGLLELPEFNNDSNCNTYVYEPKKNLGDLTIEAMPMEENYR